MWAASKAMVMKRLRTKELFRSPEISKYSDLWKFSTKATAGCRPLSLSLSTLTTSQSLKTRTKDGHRVNTQLIITWFFLTQENWVQYESHLLLIGKPCLSINISLQFCIFTHIDICICNLYLSVSSVHYCVEDISLQVCSWHFALFRQPWVRGWQWWARVRIWWLMIKRSYDHQMIKMMIN